MLTNLSERINNIKTTLIVNNNSFINALMKELKLEIGSENRLNEINVRVSMKVIEIYIVKNCKISFHFSIEPVFVSLTTSDCHIVAITLEVNNKFLDIKTLGITEFLDEKEKYLLDTISSAKNLLIQTIKLEAWQEALPMLNSINTTKTVSKSNEPTKQIDSAVVISLPLISDAECLIFRVTPTGEIDLYSIPHYLDLKCFTGLSNSLKENVIIKGLKYIGSVSRAIEIHGFIHNFINIYKHPITAKTYLSKLYEIQQILIDKVNSGEKKETTQLFTREYFAELDADTLILRNNILSLK